MSNISIIVIGIVLIASVFMMPMLGHALAKSSEEKKITSTLKKVGYTNICKLGVTTKSNNKTQMVYDNVKCNLVTPPNPPPNPPPTPTGDKTIVCLVGDLSGSTVPNMMKGCNLKIGLGDLGYQDTLSYFKSLNFNKCVIGNHDAEEDGSSSIYQEALAYCGDHWSLKIGTSTLIFGFNTQGDIGSQVSFARSSISQNPTVKTIIVVSHKNGHVFPNAHHPAEAKSLYSQIESIVPATVKLWEISGHNHNSAAAPAKNWYIAGEGGKSFYPCGTDSDWTYCDNKSLQYLELTISNTDGVTTAKFIK